jgi:hypothetical protein
MCQIKTLPFLLVLALSICIGIKTAARPSHFELAPAYPSASGTPELVMESNLPYFRFEWLVVVILDIDNEGRVTSVAAESSSDSAFARYAQAWIKSMRFEPATFRGKEVPSCLPVTLQFRPKVRLPDIHFPIDSTGAIVDADLYFKIFALNDIWIPRLEEFPSYFCDLKVRDTSIVFKYVLVKVGLDKSGRVTDVEEVSSNYPAFTRQVLSAILWARFSPAIVQSRPMPVECFVLVSFFPQINYPTRVWQSSNLDSLGPLARFRIRLLPDTVGLMSKPLPTVMPGNEFTPAGKYAAFRDTVSAVLSVDDTGRVSLRRLTKTGEKMQQAVYELGERLRFFPALDYQGHAHQFSGLVSFIFQGSPKIRILYHWLPMDNFVVQR